MSITIEFTPWAPFYARKKSDAVKRWLQAVADASEQSFKGGMGRHPPSSTPGEYPAIRTGILRGSIRTVVGSNEMTIGSNRTRGSFMVSKWLRDSGRKMSHDALKEGLKKTEGRLGRWVEWSRV
jgi:hypothetical protein